MESRRRKGARQQGRPRSQVRERALLVALLALLGNGCSPDRVAGRHSKVQGSTPTIGTDFRSVSPGQTIPPAGLGVDLVQGESASKKDASTVKATAVGAP
jgi:hypothetical protein